MLATRLHDTSVIVLERGAMAAGFAAVIVAGLATVGCAHHPPRSDTAASVPVPAERTLAFAHASVVDVTNGQVRPEQTVLVVGNRIRAVGRTGTVRVPAQAQVIDARGRYLIPGLWDMHTHLAGSPEIIYPLLIANGITGMRDMGSGVPLDTLHRWRRDVLAGARIGPPRQFFVGPLLDELSVDAWAPRDCPNCFDQRSLNLPIPDPQRARFIVDSLKAAGADFIKVHHIFSPAVYYAVVAETKRVGIPLVGHTPTHEREITVLEASDSGQRTIEHVFAHAHPFPSLDACAGDSATVEQCVPVARHLARNGTWMVLGPVYGSSRLTNRERAKRLRYWPDSLARFSTNVYLNWPDSMRDHVSRDEGWHLEVAERAGMPFLIGTDLGPPLASAVIGFELHDNLTVLVNQGLSPLAALQAVTLNPAKALGLADSLGTVETGKLADLVLLDANPLADIANTATIRAVVANGRYFDRVALDKLLADLERHGSPEWAHPGRGR